MAETFDPAASVTNHRRLAADRFEAEHAERLRARICTTTIGLLIAAGPMFLVLPPLGFCSYRTAAAVIGPSTALLIGLLLYHRTPRTSAQSERWSAVVYTVCLSGAALGLLDVQRSALWQTVVGIVGLCVILPLSMDLSSRAAVVVLGVPWLMLAAEGLIKAPLPHFAAALFAMCICPYAGVLFATRWRDRLVRAEFAARDQLAEANRQLREAEAARSRLFASLSHDFRTPLAVITGEAELLERRVGKGDDREALRQIGVNAGALSDLTNQLLELARLDAGQTPYRPSDCDAVAIVRESAAQLDADQCVASVSVRDNQEFVFVHGDPSHVRRIVSSLVVHALRHARRGVGSVEIVVARDGERVSIDVIDDGEEIPPDQRLTIFERFGSFDRDGSPASGIGVPLARELALLNGGTLELLPSERTTFRLVLPAGTPPAGGASEEADGAAAGGLARTIAADHPRRRVLVVQDNVHMARLIARVLRDDYDVEGVRTVREALAVLAASPPAAVLCDVSLPDGSGYSVLAAARVRRDGNRLPVLLLSAFSEPADRARGLALGADDYLGKPFIAVELRARLHNAITHVEARQEALRRQRDDFLAELHDGVVASLTRASIMLTSSERAETLGQRTAEAREAISEGLAESRAFLSLLEATDEPFADAVADVRRAMADTCAGAKLVLAFEVVDDHSCAWLTPTESHTLRRIMREAMTNALKHAAPTTIRCTLRVHESALFVRIEDDGRGLQHGGSPGRGLGIVARRVAHLGGSSEFGARSEGGAVITADFPLSRGLPLLTSLPDSRNIRANSHDRAIGTPARHPEDADA